MKLTVYYEPAQPRAEVYLHAWDQNGLVCHVPGAPLPQGVFQFVINSTTADPRDVSFKYYYPREAGQWERDDFIRTVPTRSATTLWTYDFSPRCLTEEPGTATVASVTVHAVTNRRYRGGRLYVWNPATGANFTAGEASRDDATATSTFVFPLDDRSRSGFHFKLIGPGNQFNDFEPDRSNRVWRPSDGAEIWIKSGQVDVRRQPIRLVQIPVDFIYPPALGVPQLNIQDLVDDFSATADATSSGALDNNLSRAQFRVSVYPDAIYDVWWSTEPREQARRFRIPLDEPYGPSIAVNGYDHWLAQAPAAGGRVALTIHRNPGSAFNQNVTVHLGIGSAAAHQHEPAARRPDGNYAADFRVLPGVPYWLQLDGESRPDGPLDFRRPFQVSGNATATLHTIDGVGGVSTAPPRAFQDVAPALRRSLLESVYGPDIVAAAVFDSREMPHGTAFFEGQVYFTVRAPHAMDVSLLLMPSPGSTPRNVRTVPMSLTADLRYWWCAVPQTQAPPGTMYRFAFRDGRELLSGGAALGEALDPAARSTWDRGKLVVDALTGAEQSWSLVADPEQIQQPLAGASWRTPGWEYLLVYELHAHRFTQRNQRSGAPLPDFDQVSAELNGGYLDRLPVTALELLPVHEFPGAQSWGYNPSLFFGIDSSYGGPEAFARMVRASHDSGRAVLLDVVFNHMMESPLQVLARDVYVSGETAWGDMVHYAHPACVEFFRQALVYLWRAFGLDGFRFDSTETIINGHRGDTGSAPYILARGPDGRLRTGEGRGWEFLGALRTALRRAADATGQPWPYLVGENNPVNDGMTDPGWGVLDGQWWFPEMDALDSAAYNGGDRAGDVATSLNGTDRPFWRAVSYAESHDSVSGQSNQQRIVRREAYGNGRQMAKAIGAAALLAEGVPMLFMGEEAAEDRPFAFDMLSSDPQFVLRLDDYEQPGSEFAQVLTWFRHLMGLRNNPGNGLRGSDGQTARTGNKTLAFSRAGGRFFVVATFGTSDTRQNLGWLGLPPGNTYKEVFNSTWPAYRVHQEPQMENGGYAARLSADSVVNLPGIGALVLERT